MASRIPFGASRAFALHTFTSGANQAPGKGATETATSRRSKTVQMESDDLMITSPSIGIIARILFTLIFFLSGITHFTAMQSYVNLMHPAIPWRAFWVIISGIVELAGAVLILFNYRPRLGGWLIVLFLTPVTIVVHGVAMVTLSDPVMRDVNVSMFLKGLAMIGCALFITQFGVRTGDRPALETVAATGKYASAR
jgi:putative oxidoreductase